MMAPTQGAETSSIGNSFHFSTSTQRQTFHFFFASHLSKNFITPALLF